MIRVGKRIVIVAERKWSGLDHSNYTIELRWKTRLHGYWRSLSLRLRYRAS